VTDRLALERSYNTLIAVQRETLDNLHEGVAVFGEDGRLKLFNPGYLSLWRVDEETARAEPHIRELVDKCKSLYIYDDWDSFRQQRIQEGMRLCQHAIKIEFYQVENYLNLARTCMLGNYRRAAVRAVADGLKVDPENRALLEIRKELGLRRSPVLPFLSRSNPFNTLLGRLRHLLRGG